jgi:hypothetical protein
MRLENPVGSDPIDDTAPAETEFDESLSYEGRSGIENHSADRFRFDVAPYEGDAERAEAETLFPSHGLFLQAHKRAHHTIPSVQTIVTYVKQLDDTIYAGVEHAVQAGLAPVVESKRTILRGVVAYLAAHRSAAGDEALSLVAGALRLGGDEPAIPADLAGRVDAVVNDFLGDPIESKPIGFYTWSTELERIWRQDRLLQRAVSTDAACALAQAIAADPARRSQYEQLVTLYAKLTNPVKSSVVSLLSPAASGACSAADPEAFLGTSRTPETELFEELYPAGVPPNADLMRDLVEAIRSGRVDLAPASDDGWYQHQLYALETLLVSDGSEERKKVGFTGRYKKRLQEAFSTLLVQHRETHVKQTGIVAVSGVYVPPTPTFRVEPLATVYVRHARSYVFLEQALESTLGAAALDAAVAVDADGKTPETLRARIGRARDLFYGLYVVSTQDLGFKPALVAVGDPKAERWSSLATDADRWLQWLSTDEVAASDVRVMVPIAALGRNQVKYWVVIGVRATVAGYSFIQGSSMGAPKPEEMTRAWLPTEQFLEVTSSPVPLSREELRKLCDEQKTADAIKAAIEARW